MGEGALSLNAIAGGGKAAVARALTLLEERAGTSPIATLLDEAYASPKGFIAGITGPPGAGKSTLIDTLIRQWRAQSFTVAVLAVDPSSQRSHGALLGDRIRMRTDPGDHHVLIRSVAAKGRLGGLSDLTFPAAILLRALYDRVVVESVGVGQSETDISTIADTAVLCIQPGSGDSLQFMKAGIVEIPDIAVVTKADMGAVANRALADLKGALQLGVMGEGEGEWEPRCLAASAATGSGLDALQAALEDHKAWLTGGGKLKAKRHMQTAKWLSDEVMAQFGRRGVNFLRQHMADGAQPPAIPFDYLQKLLARVNFVLT